MGECEILLCSSNIDLILYHCDYKPINNDLRLSILKWSKVDNKIIFNFIIKTIKLESINKYIQRFHSANNEHYCKLYSNW